MYWLEATLRYWPCCIIVAVSFFACAYHGALNFSLVIDVMCGSSKFTVALGMHNFLCMGVACTLVPFIGSLLINSSKQYFSDNAQNDARPFLTAYVFGAFMLLGSIIFLIIHRLKESRL